MKRLVRVVRTSEFWVEFDGRKMTESQLIATMNSERVDANCFHGRPTGSLLSSPVVSSSYRAELAAPENVNSL